MHIDESEHKKALIDLKYDHFEALHATAQTSLVTWEIVSIPVFLHEWHQYFAVKPKASSNPQHECLSAKKVHNVSQKSKDHFMWILKNSFISLAKTHISVSKSESVHENCC